MPTPISQSFNGGEISDLVSARPDQQRYQSGCFKLFNTICIPQGPATRRAGFRYVGQVKETVLSNDVILVPFVFSTTESRVLEFGEYYIRFYKNDALIETTPGNAYEVTTTFTASELKSLRFAQSADIVYIASSTHKPSKLSRYSDTNWVLEDIDFIPQTQTPTGVSVTNTTGVASSGKNTYKYKVTAIDASTGEESLPSAEVSITTDILNKTDGNYNDISWTANTIAPLEYRVYKYSAGIYGYIGTATHPTVTFRDDNIAADETDPPPNGENPFDAVDKYPSLVYFWQQRLGWAASNTKPFTMWLSPSAQFESMAASKPPNDDDAIEKTLAATQANIIQWVAGDRSLVIGTTGNEWSMGGTNNEVLTPDTGGFNKQGSKGSENIPPLSTGDALLYVQRGGNIVREFAYAYNSDRYESPDISIISSHLLDGKTIVSWCYQGLPFSIIWATLDDGTMIGITYVREHQVIGWHHHETQGSFEWVTSVPGPDGYDLVYAVVKRNINGTDIRYIERMENFFVREDDTKKAYFVDSGVTYSGTVQKVFTGLAPHLVGETVKVWADGAERQDVVVGAGGDITLDKDASYVTVGLPYTSDIVPARPEVQDLNNSTLGRVYKVNKATVKMFQSMGVKAGASVSELEEIIKHDATDPLPPEIVTGSVDVTIDTGWSDEWEFTIRADGPAPMTVLSVTYDTEIGEML